MRRAFKQSEESGFTQFSDRHIVPVVGQREARIAARRHQKRTMPWMAGFSFFYAPILAGAEATRQIAWLKPVVKRDNQSWREPIEA